MLPQKRFGLGKVDICALGYSERLIGAVESQ